MIAVGQHAWADLIARPKIVSQTLDKLGLWIAAATARRGVKMGLSHNLNGIHVMRNLPFLEINEESNQ